MRKLISTLASLLILSTSFAQFKNIAEGTEFEEPEDGYAKIVQLKNGNTVYLHIAIKDGIDLKLYNASHKLKAEKHFDPSYEKLKAGQIEAIFEINGDVVLMISEYDNKTPVLYRLIFDGSNGSLKEDKKIVEMQKGNMGYGYAVVFGGLPIPDFKVRKDPNSDNYALVMFNSFAADKNRRMEIVFYGSDNKEKSRGYYSSPQDKYKYLEYIEMSVIGNSKVYVLAHAYNTASSGGKESDLVMATLEGNSNEVKVQELNYNKDLKIGGAIMRYNPVSNKLILLSNVKASKKDKGYTVLIGYLDPETKKMDRSFDLFPVHANDKCEELFGKKHSFTGLPQNMFINTDGSFSIVYEEMTNYYSDRGSSYCELGHIAVSHFSVDGKEGNSYFIPKDHFILSRALPNFYHSEREGTAQFLKAGDQYKSFAYLDGKDKSYILLNDIEENWKSSLKGKLTAIRGVGECDGFYYGLNGNEVMPGRAYVFGNPESKKENNLALFAVSDYDREKNMFVTLKLEKGAHGKGKDVKLVWLQPQ